MSSLHTALMGYEADDAFVIEVRNDESQRYSLSA